MYMGTVAPQEGHRTTFIDNKLTQSINSFNMSKKNTPITVYIPKYRSTEKLNDKTTDADFLNQPDYIRENLLHLISLSKTINNAPFNISLE